MSLLAVVAYPLLEERDRRWIESLRVEHDPQAARIGVHFTLVFPAQALPGVVAAEVSAVAASVTPISFAIRRAEAVRDVLGGGGHVFLVHDEGLEEISRLHERLYEGVLRPHLRSEIPFIPHMTIAAHTEVEWCAGLAHELTSRQFSVSGTLESVDLVDVGKASVESIGSFPLG